MKNLKRILAVFLTVALLATSLMTVAVFAEEDTTESLTGFFPM